MIWYRERKTHTKLATVNSFVANIRALSLSCDWIVIVLFRLSTDFQNYLRTQAGNTCTVNIIICTVDYLLRLQVIPDVIQVIRYILQVMCYIQLLHLSRGAGTGVKWPPEIYIGVKHGILTPYIFIVKKKYFSGRLHPDTLLLRQHFVIYSETRSRRTVFFVSIYNRFVDSSKCGLRDFDPPPVKNSSRAPAPIVCYCSERFRLIITVTVSNTPSHGKSLREHDISGGS